MPLEGRHQEEEDSLGDQGPERGGQAETGGNRAEAGLGWCTDAAMLWAQAEGSA